MDPAGHKRQKLGNEHTSSTGTQSQSNIFLHNRRLRLQFLDQFSELKTGSATKDLKSIHIKRCEFIGIIERLQQVPIQQPTSPVPKFSDATLYDFGLIRSNYSSDNVINLDADEDNVEYHSQANVGNVGVDSTVSAVDSDNKDRVKSCGDESSSSNLIIMAIVFKRTCCLSSQSGVRISSGWIIAIAVLNHMIYVSDQRTAWTPTMFLLRCVQLAMKTHTICLYTEIKVVG